MLGESISRFIRRFVPGRAESGKVKERQRPAWSRYRLMRYVVVPWLFLIPILALHAFVVVFPAAQGVYYSFTDWRGVGEAEYVGLRNFEEMIFEDQSYRDALIRNIQWMLFFMTVPFAFALFRLELASESAARRHVLPNGAIHALHPAQYCDCDNLALSV